jgi:hypothetical protein
MNTNFTKNPIVGTPLTPSVIKQINTAVRRFMPIAGNGIRTTVTAGGTIISAIPAPASKKQKDKPLPFEVRYDGTLDNGAGGWKIYLPTEHLVQFDGAYLDPLNDVTPILDANGDETGWYSFDEITLQDDHVWLVVSESSGSGSSGSYTASFANAEDQQAVANICIAEVSYEAATQSTPETITIKQSVVGAIVMSSGGGGGGVVPDDISTEFIPDPPSGTQPDGDEGKLQIKGFKAGTPSEAPTDIADYLMGVANLPANGMQLVARWTDSEGAHLVYLPLGLLFRDKSGQTPADMTVEFVADSDWYASDHVLRKRLKVLNLRTGAVTDKVGTTYNNGWEVMAQTTPISSIIGSN